MLQLPTTKGAQPVLGGPAADAFFARLDRRRAPAHGATFAAYGDNVVVIPARPGVALDVPRSAAAVLAAAESTGTTAHLVVEHRHRRPHDRGRAGDGDHRQSSGATRRSTAAIPNRIHNVQLVAHLVDGKLIAPGATFSFNQATGERTAAKGFLEAPVIINGELQTGLGGGVCQVSTTVFNAAYEAGLPITARTNHALYISHYPLGRDATVDYPDIDLKFVNDTGHWLLLRTFVGSSSLVVTLYGTPQHRRVVTETAPLTVVAPPPVQKKLDPSLAPGTSEVAGPRRVRLLDVGAPPRLRAGREAALGRDLVLELRRVARDRPRRAEAEAQAEAEAAADGYDAGGPAPGALCNSGASHSGVRVGRSVCGVDRSVRRPALGDHRRRRARPRTRT